MAMEVKQICHQYLCDIVEWFLVLILELILWWLLHRALAVEWQWVDLPVLLLFNIITCLPMWIYCVSGIYQVYNNGYTVYQVYIKYIIIDFVKWRGGSIPPLLIDRGG